MHDTGDFKRALRYGRRLVHPALFIYIYKRKDGARTRRLGLVTSHKIGKAADRNRVKRRLRELFRLNKHYLEPGIDIIMMPKEASVLLNWRQLGSIVMSQWQKAGIISK
ncbi:MAG: ribonuclease P protein component [Endomicrobiales bacterium]|nr:ribonuclease P protein component [Endomicrobiales bacterium]